MFPEKASAAVAYGGTATAVVTGGAVKYLGMTPSDVSILVGIGGLVVALLGLCVNTWFKYQHLRIARAAAHVDTEA